MIDPRHPLANDAAEQFLQGLQEDLAKFKAQMDKHLEPVNSLNNDVHLLGSASGKELLGRVTACWNRFALLPEVIPDLQKFKAKLDKYRKGIEKDSILKPEVKSLYLLHTYLIEDVAEQFFNKFKLDRDQLRIEIFKNLSQRMVALQIAMPKEAKIPDIVHIAANSGIFVPKSMEKEGLFSHYQNFKSTVGPFAGPVTLLGLAGLGKFSFPSGWVKQGSTLAKQAIVLTGNVLGTAVEKIGHIGSDAAEKTGQVVAAHPQLPKWLMYAGGYWAITDLIEHFGKQAVSDFKPFKHIPLGVLACLATYHTVPVQKAGSALLVPAVQKQIAIISGVMLARYLIRPYLPESFKDLTSSTTNGVKTLYNKVTGYFYGTSQDAEPPKQGGTTESDLEKRLNELKKDKPKNPQPPAADGGPGIFSKIKEFFFGSGNNQPNGNPAAQHGRNGPDAHVDLRQIPWDRQLVERLARGYQNGSVDLNTLSPELAALVREQSAPSLDLR
ncbi:MAG: hypothetical protein HY069_03850 [Chlamydiia bacterium]|nr:hypothetical protein [Chlamydiia bacterium]